MIFQDQPLLEWRPYADDYLAELMRNESRGDGKLEICFRCGVRSLDHIPLFRCMDCFTEDLVCQKCCLDMHIDRPLDIIEASAKFIDRDSGADTYPQKWNGDFFERITLKSIGVSVQLGHRAGTKCPTPRAVEDFTVIHTNGIHSVRLAFCNCPNRPTAGDWYQQLLRSRWFPATHLNPRTAATYRVLNMFHVLTLQGKVTTYDFYAGIEKLTDNTGVEDMKVILDSMPSFYASINLFTVTGSL